MSAPSSADPKPLAKGTLWKMLGRHQVASIASTATDFGVMIGCVEILGAAPTLATAFGALAGGITNFSIGRAWTFEATHGHAGAQLLRYALVSAASAGWNVAGEHVLHDRLGVEYVLARVVVAIAVSLLWNFPLQRWFVFRASGREQRDGHEHHQERLGS